MVDAIPEELVLTDDLGVLLPMLTVLPPVTVLVVDSTLKLLPILGVVLGPM